MEPKYRFRLYLLSALVLVGCGSLLSRLHEFQIEKRAKFVANIPTTHTVRVREPGIRGEITDRNQLVLAGNKRSYEVVFNLEDIYNSWRLQNKNSDDAILEEEQTDASGMPVIRKKKDIVKIVNEWTIPRIQNIGLEGKQFSKALAVHYNTHGGFVPFSYRTDLTYDEFARLAEATLDLPGVSVTVRPRRVYSYGTLGCHFLGRVNQWEKINVPEEFSGSRNHYQGDDWGVAGIEATMNDELTGEGGIKAYVRNEKNKVIAVEDYTPPTEGARVELSIDANIQYLVENILRKIGRGAAVVMDPNTGEVLAMASVPNYDPNDFIPSIQSEKWKAYLDNKADPFMNRAIAPYTPGSVYKLPTAIAGARYGKVGFGHNCIGYTLFGTDTKIRCWKTGGHGPLGLSEATQRSCNPYFMAMAGSLRSTKMVDTFELIGLGRRSGIRLPGENSGIVPGSTFWKREIKPGAVMTSATLAQMAIGQSDSMATPLQICSVAATIANGGRYYQPRIVRRVIGRDEKGDEKILVENIPIVKANLLSEGLTEHRLEVIRKGMWKAANEQGGTAGRVSALLKDVFVAAKTGTAQTGQPDSGDKNNAWTASFGPYENPRYAICVMVRNGRSGGKVAGTLSGMIYRGIFNMEAGFKPRLTKMGVYQGDFLAIEDIELPEGEFLDIPFEDVGETGNELDTELLESPQPIKVKPNTVPLPTIAPEEDSERTPTRAQIVGEE
ncbi:penicillin-binding transpeptidase domain-containing protein [Akkermansiaceae bacterium]|nr:penicillin-binding transpeptidase domain-containing protein [Akkermansiaceae bacterium]